MSAFNQTTVKSLILGALVLGAGVYYQNVANQRVEEARNALRSVQVAEGRLEATRRSAEQYISLQAYMADLKIDRQEPFSVMSEFSPREIKQLGPLLDTLYQRDGYFFLQKFHLAWRKSVNQPELLPRVALELEGQKVLLFSDPVTSASSVAFVNH